MSRNHEVSKAGRLFVQGELIRRGHQVEESKERLSDFIIDGKTKVKVHCRENEEEDSFIMSPKVEENGSRDLYYIFVLIQNNKNRFFIVPSIVVAQRCRIGHKKWAEEKEGRNPNATLRIFFMSQNADYLWEDQWQLLDQ